MSSNPLRELFPCFYQTDQPWHYLDSAATSQKPQSVLNAIQQYYLHTNANVHRAEHGRARQATEQFEQARQRVQQFINAAQSAEIVWTKGATEAINLVANGVKGQILPGNNIVVSVLEHHANFVPWQQLCKQLNIELRVMPMLDDTSIDLQTALQLIDKHTYLVAIGHVSNALGNVNPIESIIAQAKRMNALSLIDGCQAAAHMPIDVQQLDCDFYVFSGHKMYAPTGIGVLYGKYAQLVSLPAYQYGGEMVQSVSIEDSAWQAPPLKFEAGTPNIEGAIGIASAIDFIEQYRDQIRQNESGLYHYLVHKLKRIDGIRLWASVQTSEAVIAFSHVKVNTRDLALLLAEQGVAIRAGHHCAMPLMHALNVEGLLRVSLAAYSDMTDVEALISALSKAIDALSKHAVSSAEQSSPPHALANTIKNAKGWDEKYRQIMLAGKHLKCLSDQEKINSHQVPGCESEVWVKCELTQQGVHVHADSPSKIIRGLLAVMLEPLQAQPPSYVAQFDAQAYMQQLGLAKHISASRENGLSRVIAFVQNQCAG